MDQFDKGQRLEFIARNIWLHIWLIILVILTVYIVLSLFLVFFQSKMIYYPARELEATPDNIGLPFEEVIFKSGDGVKLCGWFVPSKRSRGIILFCHGNAGNISHRLETIKIFNHLGMSTFIFDYRGYGKSEGKPSESGTYADAKSAMHWIIGKQNILPGEIIIFGRSLGGAVATRLAKEITPRALILESAFTSIPDVGAELYPWFPVRLLSRFKYDTAGYLREVKCPVQVIHSSDDELIKFSHGKQIFSTANEPKEFLEISGGHNDGFLISGKLYVEGLRSFIMRY